MTDYPDQPGFLESEAPLDEMMLYDGVECPNIDAPVMAAPSPKHFAFSHSEIAPEQGQFVPGADEALPAHYIPHAFDHGIQSMQAHPEQYFPGTFNPNMGPGAPHAFHPAPHRVSSSSSHMPHATMTEFFQLMSQPENVQAYMQFLQKQHEETAQQVQAPAPTRSRSNSQPAASSFPTTPASRTSWPEQTSDNASSRERKIAKYRTKRARRLTGSAQVPADSPSMSCSAPANDMADIHQYMPAPKIQKTLARDLENRLMSSEEEVKLLQTVLASRDAELQLLRQVFDDQQRQLAMYETTSNPSSSACTSPRPRSPSTPAMVSSPSSVSIGSSTMDIEFGGSLETSSLGSSEHMELLAAQKRQEKLRKLGGPPSDVYYPWWNGVSLNHPAFQQKEDWANVELRPHQDLLARERLNYLLNMQRFKMEQSRLSSEPMPPHHPGSPSPSSMAMSMSHPYTHQPPAFYQSPHQSHIQTGSPVQAGGYWSGHFAPNTAEKIDFSKISLRKTSSEAPPAPNHIPGLAPGSSPVSPQHLHMPVSPQHHSPLHTAHIQSSPTAAIWREAMAHPEMHAFPPHLSWIQDQPEVQHRMQLPSHPSSSSSSHRAPFRRQIPPSAPLSRMHLSPSYSPGAPHSLAPRSSPNNSAMDC